MQAEAKNAQEETEESVDSIKAFLDKSAPITAAPSEVSHNLHSQDVESVIVDTQELVKDLSDKDDQTFFAENCKLVSNKEMEISDDDNNHLPENLSLTNDTNATFNSSNHYRPVESDPGIVEEPPDSAPGDIDSGPESQASKSVMSANLLDDQR